MAWFIAARCVLSCPASWLGDGRVRPDVAHQDGHLDPLGLADFPVFLAELGGQTARQ
jgi:hypothetical protein